MYSKYTSTVYDFDFAEIFTCAKTPRCHWHRRVKLHRIIDTAESNSTKSLTPHSQAYCQWYRKVKLHEVKIMSLIFEKVFTSVKGGSFDRVFYVQDIFFTSNKCWHCFLHDSNSFGSKIHDLKTFLLFQCFDNISWWF